MRFLRRFIALLLVPSVTLQTLARPDVWRAYLAAEPAFCHLRPQISEVKEAPLFAVCGLRSEVMSSQALAAGAELFLHPRDPKSSSSLRLSIGFALGGVSLMGLHLVFVQQKLLVRLHPLDYFFNLFLYCLTLSLLFAWRPLKDLFAALRANTIHVTRSQWLSAHAAGLLNPIAAGMTLGFAIKFYPIHVTEVALISVLGIALQFFLARFWLKERLTKNQILGSVFVLAGATVITFTTPATTLIGPPFVHGGYERWIGIGLAVLSATAISLSNIIRKKLAAEIKTLYGEKSRYYRHFPQLMTFAGYLISFVAAGVLIQFWRGSAPRLIWDRWVLAVASLLIFYWLSFYKTIKRLPISVWVPIQATTPIWTMGWSAGLGGYLPPVLQWTGAILALIGVSWASYGIQKETPPAAPASPPGPGTFGPKKFLGLIISFLLLPLATLLIAGGTLLSVGCANANRRTSVSVPAPPQPTPQRDPSKTEPLAIQELRQKLSDPNVPAAVVEQMMNDSAIVVLLADAPDIVSTLGRLLQKNLSVSMVVNSRDQNSHLPDAIIHILGLLLPMQEARDSLEKAQFDLTDKRSQLIEKKKLNEKEKILLARIIGLIRLIGNILDPPRTSPRTSYREHEKRLGGAA